VNYQTVYCTAQTKTENDGIPSHPKDAVESANGVIVNRSSSRRYEKWELKEK